MPALQHCGATTGGLRPPPDRAGRNNTCLADEAGRVLGVRSVKSDRKHVDNRWATLAPKEVASKLVASSHLLDYILVYDCRFVPRPDGRA